MKTLFRNLSKRLHTARRLTALMLTVSSLLLSLAIVNVWNIKQLQTHSEETHSKSVDSIHAAVELEIHIQDLRHHLDQYLLLRELDNPQAAISQGLMTINNRKESIDHWLKQSKASAQTDRALKLVEQVKTGLDQFYLQIDELYQVPVTAEKASQLANKAEKLLETEVLVPARTYLNIDEALLEDSLDDAANQSHRLISILTYLAIIGACTALLAGFSLARMINRSLFQMRIPMMDVAGKLSEVAGDVIVSTQMDLSDLGPLLEKVSKEVTSVVEQLHARHKEILHNDQLASVGQLASGIAHEIRNPLMSMKILVQSAIEHQPAMLDARDLEILNEEIRRLEKLLDDFLDYARPKPLKKTDVDLRQLADNVVTFLQPQADLRSVTLDCKLPEESVWAYVDEPRIRQILINLILNGIRATKIGSCVQLTLDTLDNEDSNWCRIRVSDEGPGIPAELGTRIFEPFYSTEETGLGLGLPVSQRIIRSHGGEITLDERSSSGAQFVVLIPRHHCS